jgi:peroxiredoxin
MSAWILALALVFTPVAPTVALAQKMPKLEPRKGCRVGDLAHDFSLEDLDGRTHSLEALRGKRVVQVVFWATWCIPCVEEIPRLREVYERHRDDGLELLGVAVPLSQTREGVREFAEEFHINYPILWDAEGTMMDRYGVESLPQTFLIGLDGVIRHAGGHLPKDYDKMVETLLGEGAAHGEARVEARTLQPSR